MKKKNPFLRVVPLKAITKDTVKRLVIAYVVIFWLLPLITLIPREAIGYSLMNWYLLLIVPASLITTGVIVGMNYGFYPALALGVAVGSFFPALVYRFLPAWQYSIYFGVIVIAGNLLTELLKTTSKERYIKKSSL